MNPIAASVPMERHVVILCGPPGAGKTTAAHQSGLTVYDRDDPQWATEQQFIDAISELAHQGDARVVIIRSGATQRARDKWASITNATHVYVITTDAATCKARVTQRGRADLKATYPAITQWWADYQPGQPFPGWDAHYGEHRDEDDW